MVLPRSRVRKGLQQDQDLAETDNGSDQIIGVQTTPL